jgi:hypothetical protein
MFCSSVVGSITAAAIAQQQHLCSCFFSGHDLATDVYVTISSEADFSGCNLRLMEMDCREDNVGPP